MCFAGWDGTTQTIAADFPATDSLLRGERDIRRSCESVPDLSAARDRRAWQCFRVPGARAAESAQGPAQNTGGNSPAPPAEVCLREARSEVWPKYMRSSVPAHRHAAPNPADWRSLLHITPC